MISILCLGSAILIQLTSAHILPYVPRNNIATPLANLGRTPLRTGNAPSNALLAAQAIASGNTGNIIAGGNTGNYLATGIAGNIFNAGKPIITGPGNVANVFGARQNFNILGANSAGNMLASSKYGNVLGAGNLGNFPQPVLSNNGNRAAFRLITSGYPVTVTSGSPGSPGMGIQIVTNGIEVGGNVAVSGQMPLTGTVAINGRVPSDGSATVNYSCGRVV